MSRSDDAFSWDGDDDPTLDPGWEGAGDEPAEADEPAAAPSEPAAAASAAEPLAAADDVESADAGTAGVAEVGGSGSGAPVQESTPAAGADAEEADDEAAEDAPRRLGDVALVSLGVIGGVYALWTAGWVFGALRLRAAQGDDPMFLASMVLAVIAPAIWFVASWGLTSRRPSWVRFVALIAGAAVLVPWPFMMVGVSGQ